MPLIAILAASAVAVLAFDVVAGLAARRSGVDYAWFSIGSFVVWALAGVAAATVGPWWWAPVAGAVTALVESTAGWAISSRLGVGVPARPGGRARVAAAVTVTGAAIGFLGGLLAGLA